MHALVFFGMLFAASGQAAVPTAIPCLNDFAFLATSDADAPALAVSTYGKLLDSLGANATEATLKKAIEGQDPFVFPDQDGHDFSALQKRLGELKALLDLKGWNTPPVREQIRASLRQRLGELASAAEARDKGLAKAWNEHSFTFPSAHLEYVVSPDGRWILASHCPNGAALTQTWKMSSVNLATRQVESQPGSAGYLSAPEFSGDGKFLLFPMDKHQLKKVPVTDGVPDWANAITVGNHLNSGWLRVMKGVGDRYFFAGYRSANANTLFRFDLKENTRTNLNLQPHLPIPAHLTNVSHLQVDGAAQEWVAFPDGKHIAYTIERLYGVGDRRIVVFEITDNGELVPKRTLGPWPSSEKSKMAKLHLAENGDIHYLRGMDYFVAKAGATNGVKAFTIIPPPPEWKLESPSFQYRPGHPEIAVTYSDKNHKRYYVQFWNTANGELRGGTDLPENTHDFSFTPDGTKMLSWRLGPRQTIVVSNPENVKPEPASNEVPTP